MVFSSGERDYTVRDLIDWAAFRGELDGLWRNTLRTVEAEKAASDRGLEPKDDSIERESVAFRYEHDLITAEETEMWLEQRQLTLRDFSDYFARRYWGATLGNQITPPDMDYTAATPALRETLVADLAFSGELDRMAMRLSRRVVAEKVAGAKDVDAAMVADERERFLQRTGASEAGLAGWLERHGRDAAWLDEMLRMEAGHRRDSEALLNPKARDREMSILRLPLTRFEMETVEVESSDAAHEAILCIRNDGMSMEELAEEARYPFQKVSVLMEDIDGSIQQKFLSVTVGEVLDPIPQGDGFQVCRVVGKSEPSLEDMAVLNRVDQRIRERHFSDLVNKHISWRITPASEE